MSSFSLWEGGRKLSVPVDSAEVAFCHLHALPYLSFSSACSSYEKWTGFSASWKYPRVTQQWFGLCPLPDLELMSRDLCVFTLG
jgi:hypothetical protein